MPELAASEKLSGREKRDDSRSPVCLCFSDKRAESFPDLWPLIQLARSVEGLIPLADRKAATSSRKIGNQTEKLNKGRTES